MAAEGTRYDPTCKAHTHMADDGRAGDRHIAGDYRDRDSDRDCSLVTNLNRADRQAARVRPFRPAHRRRFADVALADLSSQTNGS